MKPVPLPVRLLLVCLAAGMTAPSGLGAGPSLQAETATLPAGWIVRHQGRTVLEYAYAPGRYKPFVRQLATIDGRNLLRDAPSDHLHHHALMYAVRANGINFWEEVPGSGVQKVVETTTTAPEGVGPGKTRATLSQVLHWVAAEHALLPDTGPHALLVEHRSLALEIDEASEEVALVWRSEFRTGGSRMEVAIAGANYFGLGARFLAELDAQAVHFAASGPIDVAGQRQDVSPHPWAAVGFGSGDAASTFAVMGHPRNPGGAPWFFSMKSPFAYLSATQQLDRQPRTLGRDDRIVLEYLVVVLPKRASVESLDARYRRWAGAAP